MYSLHLRSGRSVTSAMLQRSLADCGVESGSELGHRRMAYMVSIERLESRGMQYSNEDFDVLSGALNFLDAVQPDHGLRG